MGRKGVEKRKPKTKSKAGGSDSADTRAGAGSLVQTLVKDSTIPTKKGVTTPASGVTKR